MESMLSRVLSAFVDRGGGFIHVRDNHMLEKVYWTSQNTPVNHLKRLVGQDVYNSALSYRKLSLGFL